MTRTRTRVVATARGSWGGDWRVFKSLLRRTDFRNGHIFHPAVVSPIGARETAQDGLDPGRLRGVRN